MTTFDLAAKWAWFPQARYGMFIHWGPYSQYERGEQVLFREHLDHHEYAARAAAWDPQQADPAVWADAAVRAGMTYACFTTRHHDGFCLWDTDLTDYSTERQTAQRDFVAEYVEAFRAAGLRIGLYYSWIDWRLPAYFDGPATDPVGWTRTRDYLHGQVEELLTRYGKIDHFCFDGTWPRSTEDLDAVGLVDKMRQWQPDILINNRLGMAAEGTGEFADGGVGAGHSDELGDFGTPEHHITAESNRLWESCQTSTWRLWGFSRGERWRSADLLLDMLCECAEKGGSHGGNLLLNVGPQPDGQLPAEFVERSREIGDWLAVHGEAVFGTDGGDVTEFVTRGRQTTRDHVLYLIMRFWDGQPTLRLADLESVVERVTLVTTGQTLDFVQDGDVLEVLGLPAEAPTRLFPVIKIECDSPPRSGRWGRERLWAGDPTRVADWARTRGTSVWLDGRERDHHAG